MFLKPKSNGLAPVAKNSPDTPKGMGTRFSPAHPRPKTSRLAVLVTPPSICSGASPISMNLALFCTIRSSVRLRVLQCERDRNSLHALAGKRQTRRQKTNLGHHPPAGGQPFEPVRNLG